MNKRDICAKCRYWMEVSSQARVEDSIGRCRRYPPSIIIIDQQITSMFPETPGAFACGEYKRG